MLKFRPSNPFSTISPKRSANITFEDLQLVALIEKGLNDSSLRGYLYKRSSTNNKWRLKWFLLFENLLFYFDVGSASHHHYQQQQQTGNASGNNQSIFSQVGGVSAIKSSLIRRKTITSSGRTGTSSSNDQQQQQQLNQLSHSSVASTIPRMTHSDQPGDWDDGTTNFDNSQPPRRASTGATGEVDLEAVDPASSSGSSRTSAAEVELAAKLAAAASTGSRLGSLSATSTPVHQGQRQRLSSDPQNGGQSTNDTNASMSPLGDKQANNGKAAQESSRLTSSYLSLFRRGPLDSCSISGISGHFLGHNDRNIAGSTTTIAGLVPPINSGTSCSSSHSSLLSRKIGVIFLEGSHCERLVESTVTTRGRNDAAAFQDQEHELNCIFTLKWRKHGSKEYEFRAETEAEARTWTHAISNARYSSLLNDKEHLEQRYLHLSQIVESESTAKWQMAHQCEELALEVEKLRQEVMVLKRQETRSNHLRLVLSRSAAVVEALVRQNQAKSKANRSSSGTGIETGNRNRLPAQPAMSTGSQKKDSKLKQAQPQLEQQQAGSRDRMASVGGGVTADDHSSSACGALDGRSARTTASMASGQAGPPRRAFSMDQEQEREEQAIWRARRCRREQLHRQQAAAGTSAGRSNHPLRRLATAYGFMSGVPGVPQPAVGESVGELAHSNRHFQHFQIHEQYHNSLGHGDHDQRLNNNTKGYLAERPFHSTLPSGRALKNSEQNRSWSPDQRIARGVKNFISSAESIDESNNSIALANTSVAESNDRGPLEPKRIGSDEPVPNDDLVDEDDHQAALRRQLKSVVEALNSGAMIELPECLLEAEVSEELRKIKKVQGFFRGWLCRRRWKQIVQEYIKSPHAESMRKRNNLVFRMVENEEEYVEQLTLLISAFLRPIKMTASSQRPPLSHDELNSIFLNAETLLFLHQIFLKGLTARMESWPTLVLGDLFNMLLPMLTIYQEFVRNHHFSLQVLAECKQREQFSFLLRRLEERPQLNGRTLETFLTYPMHQIPRYIICLHEILAHTPHNHVERKNLYEAQTKLEDLSRQMHDEVSETENIRQNLAIERMIIGGCDLLLDVNQVFVRQGILLQVLEQSASYYYHYFCYINNNNNNNCPQQPSNIHHNHSTVSLSPSPLLASSPFGLPTGSGLWSRGSRSKSVFGGATGLWSPRCGGGGGGGGSTQFESTSPLLGTIQNGTNQNNNQYYCDNPTLSNNNSGINNNQATGKNVIRQCFLFTNHLLLCTRTKDGKLTLLEDVGRISLSEVTIIENPHEFFQQQQSWQNQTQHQSNEPLVKAKSILGYNKKGSQGSTVAFSYGTTGDDGSPAAGRSVNHQWPGEEQPIVVDSPKRQARGRITGFLASKLSNLANLSGSSSSNNQQSQHLMQKVCSSSAPPSPLTKRQPPPSGGAPSSRSQRQSVLHPAGGGGGGGYSPLSDFGNCDFMLVLESKQTLMGGVSLANLSSSSNALSNSISLTNGALPLLSQGPTGTGSGIATTGGSQTLVIHLVAPSLQEKTAWLSDLSQCIDNIHFNDLFHSSVNDPSSLTMNQSVRTDPRLYNDDVDIKFSRALNSCKLPQIRYASKERLFERLTDLRFLSIDFLNTFLLTYRVFTTAEDVLEALKNVHYNCDRYYQQQNNNNHHHHQHQSHNLSNIQTSQPSGGTASQQKQDQKQQTSSRADNTPSNRGSFSTYGNLSIVSLDATCNEVDLTTSGFAESTQQQIVGSVAHRQASSPVRGSGQNISAGLAGSSGQNSTKFLATPTELYQQKRRSTISALTPITGSTSSLLLGCQPNSSQSVASTELASHLRPSTTTTEEEAPDGLDDSCWKSGSRQIDNYTNLQSDSAVAELLPVPADNESVNGTRQVRASSFSHGSHEPRLLITQAPPTQSGQQPTKTDKTRRVSDQVPLPGHDRLAPSTELVVAPPTTPIESGSLADLDRPKSEIPNENSMHHDQHLHRHDHHRHRRRRRRTKTTHSTGHDNSSGSSSINLVSSDSFEGGADCHSANEGSVVSSSSGEAVGGSSPEDMCEEVTTATSGGTVSRKSGRKLDRQPRNFVIVKGIDLTQAKTVDCDTSADEEQVNTSSDSDGCELVNVNPKVGEASIKPRTIVSAGSSPRVHGRSLGKLEGKTKIEGTIGPTKTQAAGRGDIKHVTSSRPPAPPPQRPPAPTTGQQVVIEALSSQQVPVPPVPSRQTDSPTMAYTQSQQQVGRAQGERWTTSLATTPRSSFQVNPAAPEMAAAADQHHRQSKAGVVVSSSAPRISSRRSSTASAASAFAAATAASDNPILTQPPPQQLSSRPGSSYAGSMAAGIQRLGVAGRDSNGPGTDALCTCPTSAGSMPIHRNSIATGSRVDQQIQLRKLQHQLASGNSATPAFGSNVTGPRVGFSSASGQQLAPIVHLSTCPLSGATAGPLSGASDVSSLCNSRASSRLSSCAGLEWSAGASSVGTASGQPYAPSPLAPHKSGGGSQRSSLTTGNRTTLVGGSGTRSPANNKRHSAASQINIRSVATIRVLSVLRHWVSKHSQDFVNDTKLSFLVQQFLQDLISDPSLLPAEHKAALQLQQMVQKAAHQRDNQVDLDLLLAPPAKPSPDSIETLSALEIAETMTYLDHKIFLSIRSEEFLGQAWMKVDKSIKAPHILLITKRFNDVSRLVSSEIVRVPELHRRVAVIEKWTNVAHICRVVHNFNGVLQIGAAFTNSAVFRLKKTWDKVPKTTKNTIEQLQNLVSTDSRFRNMRDAINRCDPPSIPYVGMYLTDLSFIEEGTPNYSPDSLLNFSKMRMIANVIREIQHLQNGSYKIELNRRVANYLLDSSRHLQDDEMYRCSLSIEPKSSGAKNGMQLISNVSGSHTNVTGATNSPQTSSQTSNK